MERLNEAPMSNWLCGAALTLLWFSASSAGQDFYMHPLHALWGVWEDHYWRSSHRVFPAVLPRCHTTDWSVSGFLTSALIPLSFPSPRSTLCSHTASIPSSGLLSHPQNHFDFPSSCWVKDIHYLRMCKIALYAPSFNLEVKNMLKMAQRCIAIKAGVLGLAACLTSAIYFFSIFFKGPWNLVSKFFFIFKLTTIQQTFFFCTHLCAVCVKMCNWHLKVNL